jgi:hypothetical protein
MRDSMQIRPAQPGDAEVAAVLLYSAYTHIKVAFPLSEEHDSGLIEYCQARCAARDWTNKRCFWFVIQIV